MTTVTERRIVREVQGNEEAAGNANANDAVAYGLDEPDSKRISATGILKNNKPCSGVNESRDEGYVRFDDVLSQPKPDGEDQNAKTSNVATLKLEGSDPSELSLSFKIGNVALVSNNLKPNSAVRQLFPDPRFISPPPGGAGKTTNIGVEENRENYEEDTEGQKFLITTESLRLFDAVKRSKLNQSTESEPEPTTIRKTIERNALRRSLICKYDAPLNAKKKNLRSKEFTLEERIRQLTCLDLDDNRDTESSASENTTTGDSSDYLDFPVRTSPSGEEAKTVSSSASSVAMLDHQSIQSSNPSPQSSTYKKITDLFANTQKKSDNSMTAPNSEQLLLRNLPDLGIGNNNKVHNVSAAASSSSAIKNPVAKMNSDARKQFLASLAPLSCVAGTGIENREDYYQLSSSKVNQGSISSRDSVSCNSDSSYSLEDIETVLRTEDHQNIARNFHRNNSSSGPPDVTRGTPTTAGDEDSATEELLAFVEQDKTRTERIKKRYNDQPDENHQRDQDEDDELNDYGFNRRPSVRGIKPKFGSTNEIIRQLQTRNSVVVPPDGVKQTPPGSMQHLSWQNSYNLLYENGGGGGGGGGTVENLQEEDETYQTIAEGRETSTINRINTMQRQIDDIYQTIAETAANVQGSMNRGSYLESTLPRTGAAGNRLSVNGESPMQRYSNSLIVGEHKSGGAVRMLRIAGGGEPQSQQSTLYGTLPGKTRRHSQGYEISAPPAPPPPPSSSSSVNKNATLQNETPKCFRTMYLVPYSGISDPTYQNIQRILPPLQNSTNYGNHHHHHLERYPYPRNAPRIEESNQNRGYYTAARHAAAAQSATATVYSQSALHLHLQEDIRVPNTLAIHHGIHAAHPLASQSAYGIQNIAYPPANNQTRIPAGYPYQIHHLPRGSGSGSGSGSIGANDVQTQTTNAPSVGSTSSSSANNSSPQSLYVYNNANVVQSQLPNAISNAILTSSPTKIHHQRTAMCTAGERGVPEGAASAPSHDYIQPNNSNQLIGHSGHNGPPPNTQNSVYYAMNV